MSSSQTVVILPIGMSESDNGSLYERECDMLKFFGDSALTRDGKVASFQLFQSDVLSGIDLPIAEVFLVKKDLVLYLTSNQEFYCAWRNPDGSVKRNTLVCESVKTVTVTRRNKPRVAILTTQGEIKLTSFGNGTVEEFVTLNDTLPSNVSSIQLAIFGPVEFIASLNSDHQVTLYLIDPFNNLRRLSTSEKVLAIAEYEGRLYLLKEDRKIYEWGASGQRMYEDRLLVMNKYGAVLMTDRDSCSCTSNSTWRYFTLLEYIKFEEGKAYCYLEIA